MFKRIATALIFLIASFSSTVTFSAPPPEVAAVHIMTDALLALKESKAQGKNSIEDIEDLIVKELLPNLDINESTKQALKKHWNELKPRQQAILKTYIAVSLVDNYSAILASYDNLDSIQISADPLVKRKDNKAIVKLNIYINGSSKPVEVSLKMILSNDWYIYDVVFSGVSLVKNYQASFGSQIKQKGIEGLIAKASKKLRKHSAESCPVCIAMNFKKSILAEK
ncbi:hypothetical protein BHECKSOX_79 [Bathymodiolus heckerae thiotrophic gill symbiont]|uniref:MlaC/ttg2D family ABC transporter substrate-binding protein n=1 Tax=Bathymodiolus heckerae thiotrophic gill symbiont TaxID=1052212 RepID=UPI0010B6BD79|nr:ABC transporter substrate-binding protein [Bathymodiolus heckerae thiotrophic gill symbiont]SHN89930.1 hypothetical protein BHECKSOX_79 [Bathymodiolus heckerae thiotrophic gill symbiont]